MNNNKKKKKFKPNLTELSTVVENNIQCCD